MNRRHDPAGIAPRSGEYSHGLEVPAGAYWPHVAGQVRDRALGDARRVSILVVVCALASAEWLIETDMVAAAGP
jgi:hypothetical protein